MLIKKELMKNCLVDSKKEFNSLKNQIKELKI